MTIDTKLKKMKRLIDQAIPIARDFKKLTGKPLGITGEVAEVEAASLLKLTLEAARNAGFDARKGKRTFQIKGRVIPQDAKKGQRTGNFNLDHECDAVLLVILDDEFIVTEIREAEWNRVKEAINKPRPKATRKRKDLSFEEFEKISVQVYVH